MADADHQQLPRIPLETERLLLRDFALDDWPAVHEYARRLEVARFMTWGPNTVADTQAFVRRATVSRDEDPRRDHELAVVEKSTGRLVGGCGITIDAGPHRNAFLGYCLHPDVWGRGYATEASRALLRFGFLTLGAHRVWTTCDPENHASARVLQKIGMRQEGHLREDVWVRGQWRDELILAVLDPEWQALTRSGEL
ncbi:MAG: GNAT family protein [Gemmatimonadota bacterium]